MGRRDREAVARGTRLYEAAQAVAADHERAVEEVRAALAPICDGLAARELDAIPVARLKEVTEGGLRLGEVERGGFRTVGQVLDAGPYRLRQIPGVGRQTAAQAVAAARRIAEAVRETIAVCVDVDRPDPRTTALLVALHVLVEAGPEARRALAAARALTCRLGPLLDAARLVPCRLRLLLAGGAARERALKAASEIRALIGRAEREGVPRLLAQASVDLLRGPPTELAALVDFELRPAEYYRLIAEIADQRPDPAAAEAAADVSGTALVRRIVEDEQARLGAFRGGP
ncbi:hypothetical protein [Streptomyces sp. NPDC059533]|uniref:hypothetical protein n=1 Tax=unclassified Streptomyces TaxID=2593676 RepID=UPI0036829B3F